MRSVLLKWRLGSLLPAALLVVLSCTPAAGADYISSVDKKALQIALDQYTSCNKECAVGLSATLVDGSIDQGLDLVASVPKLATEKNTKLRMVLFYALVRRAYEKGGKVVSSYGACSNQCDALNAQIVVLGRSGALGPMIHNQKVDERIFSNAEVVKAYEAFVKPIDGNALKVPWQFYNEAWWKKIESTA